MRPTGAGPTRPLPWLQILQPRVPGSELSRPVVRLSPLGSVQVWEWGYVLSTKKAPSWTMPQNCIRIFKKQEKRRKKGPPAWSSSDQEHRTATTRQLQNTAAGRPETGPVIPPPRRAPPRARDHSGAFLPWAAPPSPHRHLALFLSEAAAAPRQRSCGF